MVIIGAVNLLITSSSEYTTPNAPSKVWIMAVRSDHLVTLVTLQRNVQSSYMVKYWTSEYYRKFNN